MIYELWYEDTGNIIDAYKAETDALAEVRAFIEDYGPSSIETMVLLAATGRKRETGHRIWPATGRAGNDCHTHPFTVGGDVAYSEGESHG
ncbi:MAG: hypothetical protein ACR2M3_21595 [Thermomicrobiales bacterium]